MNNYQIGLSQRTLEMAKKNEDFAALRVELYYMPPRKFEKSLHTDDLKKEFWVAIYNAFILIMARESAKGEIDFKKKRIKIARTLLSLNDIKYGILKIRKHRMKLLNFTTFFYSNAIKKMALVNPDQSLASALLKNPFEALEHENNKSKIL